MFLSITANVKNKSSMELEDKIQRIVENAKYCGLHSREATRQILLLLDVVGRSEQFFCNNERMGVRCVEQCLGCFQFQNKD
jgi:hypothetical protein